MANYTYNLKWNYNHLWHFIFNVQFKIFYIK